MFYYFMRFDKIQCFGADNGQSPIIVYVNLRSIILVYLQAELKQTMFKISKNLGM